MVENLKLRFSLQVCHYIVSHINCVSAHKNENFFVCILDQY